MVIRAPISPGYRWRLGIIGLVCMGFAAYCFYDGYYAYPKQRDQYLKWKEFEQQGEAGKRAWEVHARAQGWRVEIPKERSNLDIYTQYMMLAIVLPFGLVFTGSFIRSTGRWVEMDETGYRTSSGQNVPFGAIEQLNLERWHNKGIAVVRYRDQRIQRTLTLDDWKFDRPAITTMVETLQAKLRPDQLLGKREEPPATAAPATSDQANPPSSPSV